MNNKENGISYNDFQFAQEHGIIDTAHVQEQIEMKKREELLKQHPYNIWRGKDDYWRVYIPDPSRKSGRRLIKKKSKESVQDAIVSYLKDQEDNPTIADIYRIWIEQKLNRKQIEPSTMKRYDRQFEQCLTEWGATKIKDVSRYDVEEYIWDIVSDKSLTQKAYSNLCTLLRGIFSLARKKGYIDFSIRDIIEDNKIPRKLFRKPKKQNAEVVFTDEEQLKLDQWFTSHWKKDLGLVDYGIAFAFVSGLRPGELVSLKWTDFSEDMVHISRTEIKDDQYSVREDPKTEAGIRDVVLPKLAEKIIRQLRRINPFGEYVFMKNGKRLHIASFDRRLRTICNKLGIVEKSMNKIRKTYATLLLNRHVDDSIVTTQMGHTDIGTTIKYYYKDKSSLARKQREIDRAFDLGNLVRVPPA